MSKKNQEWEVEKIIRRGRFNNTTQYLVLWKGYSQDEATWEPITNLQNCQESIIEFERGLKQNNAKNKNKKELMKKFNFRKVYNESEQKQTDNLKKEILKCDDDPQIMPQNSPIDGIKAIEMEQSPRQIIKQSKALTFDQDANEGNSKKVGENGLIREKQVHSDDKKRLNMAQEKSNLLNYESPPSKRFKKDEPEASCLNEIIPNYNVKAASKQAEGIPVEKVQISQKSAHQFPEQPAEIENEEQKKKTPATSYSILQKNSGQSEVGDKKNIKIQSISKIVSDAKSSSGQSEAQSKFFDESKTNLTSRKFQRYQFCDKQYELSQKIMLMNVMRKMYGKGKLKSPINIIDLTNKHALLRDLTCIQKIDTECAIESVDLLVKIEYGWLAIGKISNQFIMIDVNLIREDSWNLLVNILVEKNPKT